MRFTLHISRSTLPLLVLLLLAFALRLYALDFQPLWFDEGKSVFFANQTPWDTAILTAEDIHPPLYYYLLHGWALLAEWSPFVLRFLSVGLSLLAVPLIYQLGRLLTGRRTVGLLASLVLTLAPFPIYYAQETRMYALVTTLGLASTYCMLRILGSQPARRHWLAYVAVTAVALYAHYYAAFIPLFQTIFVLVYARRYRHLLRRWFGTMAILGFLYAPWLVLSYGVLTSYVVAKVAHEAYPPLPIWEYLADHLVAFSAGTVGNGIVLTIICVPLAVLGLFTAWRYGRPKAQAPDPNPQISVAGDLLPASCSLPPAPCSLPPASCLLLYLLVPLAAGFVINLFFPFHPPHYERQFLYVAPAFYLLVASGVTGLVDLAGRIQWAVWVRRATAISAVSVALLALAASDALALHTFYTTPRYAADDYRPLVARTQALVQPDDVVVCIYPWQVGYFQSYLHPPRPTLYFVPVPAWSDEAGRMEADLDDLLDEHPRLWFPSYQVAGRILETRVETYLGRAAYIIEQGWYENNKLLFCTSARPLPAPAPGARFGEMVALQEYQMAAGEFQSAWGVIPVRLNWQLLNRPQGRFLVTLRLADAGGRTWTLSDSEPQAGLRPFTLWAAGEQADDRRAILVPAGTPPGAYSLYLSLHPVEGGQPLSVTGPDDKPRGAELLLGQVSVDVARETPPLEALPIQYRREADFGDVRLLGYSIGGGPLRAGQAAPVTLFWQALRTPPGDYLLAVELHDEAGHNQARSVPRPLGALYPTSGWHAGEYVVDHYDVVPAAGAGGALRLTVAVYDAASQPVGKPVPLQPVFVIGREPNFNVPEIRYPVDARLGNTVRLLGYEIQTGSGELTPPSSPVRPGQTITLTLYWQCLAPMNTSYKVFTHLIDPQHPADIWAQDDAEPGRGATPTTGWVPGEVLTDTYRLVVKPETPPGTYRLSVGMYDPGTGARLPVTDQAGAPLGDHLLLQAVSVEVAYP